MMTALLDKICMMLLSMMYLPLACSYSCGLSCKTAKEGLILSEVLPSCLSKVAVTGAHPCAAAGMTQPIVLVGATWHHVALVTCTFGSHSTSRFETEKSCKADLEALFLNSGLIQHIHISCHLCQIVHLLPLNASSSQKVLDVCLQISERLSSRMTALPSMVQHMG